MEIIGEVVFGVVVVIGLVFCVLLIAFFISEIIKKIKPKKPKKPDVFSFDKYYGLYVGKSFVHLLSSPLLLKKMSEKRKELWKNDIVLPALPMKENFDANAKSVKLNISGETVIDKCIEKESDEEVVNEIVSSLCAWATSNDIRNGIVTEA